LKIKHRIIYSLGLFSRGLILFNRTYNVTLNIKPQNPININSMRIIARSTLKEFWLKHSEAEQPLKAWFQDVTRSQWESPSDLKKIYANASIVANNRVVFNIKGNTYRLVVHVRYDISIVFIRFIGTHQEYDKIDVTTI
jgi:mRNA interferase HigB